MRHSRPMRSMAVAILTTMISGLMAFVADFHYSSYPQTKERIKVLETRVNTHAKFLERIDNNTQKIYEHLLEKNK